MKFLLYDGNNATDGGALYFSSTTSIASAVYLISYVIKNKVAMKNNKALNGGAMYLDDATLEVLLESPSLTISENYAVNGGAFVYFVYLTV